MRHQTRVESCLFWWVFLDGVPFNRCCAKDSTLASNTPVVDDDEQLPSPVWSVYNVPAKKPPMPTESSTIKEVVEEDDDVLRWCRRRDDDDIAD